MLLFFQEKSKSDYDKQRSPGRFRTLPGGVFWVCFFPIAPVVVCLKNKFLFLRIVFIVRIFVPNARNMKTTSEYLAILKSYKVSQAGKYGVTRMGIFGSVARGEQQEDSDIDICYEGKAPSLLTLDKMQSELKNLFGCSVDLVRMRESMNDYLKERITKEAIYV